MRKEMSNNKRLETLLLDENEQSMFEELEKVGIKYEVDLNSFEPKSFVWLYAKKHIGGDLLRKIDKAEYRIFDIELHVDFINKVEVKLKVGLTKRMNK